MEATPRNWCLNLPHVFERTSNATFLARRLSVHRRMDNHTQKRLARQV